MTTHPLPKIRNSDITPPEALMEWRILEGQSGISDGQKRSKLQTGEVEEEEVTKQGNPEESLVRPSWIKITQKPRKGTHLPTHRSKRNHKGSLSPLYFASTLICA